MRSMAESLVVLKTQPRRSHAADARQCWQQPAGTTCSTYPACQQLLAQPCGTTAKDSLSQSASQCAGHWGSCGPPCASGRRRVASADATVISSGAAASAKGLL